MTFTAYIQRQKSLIRSRREDSIVFARREELAPEKESEYLFEELSSMKGLNTAERLHFSEIF